MALINIRRNLKYWFVVGILLTGDTVAGVFAFLRTAGTGTVSIRHFRDSGKSNLF